jgi:hypothetical protein
VSRRGMSAPVEIEFAANPSAPEGERPEFAILQVRPLVVGREEIDLDDKLGDGSRVVIYSEQVLGNGNIADIGDIVLVDPERFDRGLTPEVAREVCRLNRILQKEGRPYLLIGPGRWGSRDRWLGIPVAWSDISWARIIVETDMVDVKVEPSQGNHFFHNLTSFEVGYFTAHEGEANASLDWDWLLEQESVGGFKYLKHIRPENPLTAYLDGRRGRGAILRDSNGSDQL